jgi:hypothetical protein
MKVFQVLALAALLVAGACWFLDSQQGIGFVGAGFAQFSETSRLSLGWILQESVLRMQPSTLSTKP